MIWDEKSVDKLLQLKSSGLSAGQMVAEFPGVSRNALIGKLHRLAIINGHKPKSRVAKEKIKRHIAERSNPFIPPNLKSKTKIFTGVGHTEIYDLTSTCCRWPFGDGPPFKFCGKKNVDGYSYCKDHVDLIYWKRKSDA